MADEVEQQVATADFVRDATAMKDVDTTGVRVGVRSSEHFVISSEGYKKVGGTSGEGDIGYIKGKKGMGNNRCGRGENGCGKIQSGYGYLKGEFQVQGCKDKSGYGKGDGVGKGFMKAAKSCTCAMG